LKLTDSNRRTMRCKRASKQDETYGLAELQQLPRRIMQAGPR
jgi:hypothetical protein